MQGCLEAGSNLVCKSLESDEIIVTYQNILPAGFWDILEIQTHKMLSQPSIECLVYLIEYQIQQVEPRDQSRREINVACDGQIHIIFRPNRIGCCQDRCPSIERGNNSSLRNGDRLLFLIAITSQNQSCHWTSHHYSP